MSFNELTSEEKIVIEEKGTEAPFKGEYDDFYHEGIYICKKCNSPLFLSKTKFDAGCGWPSFDENFPGAIKRMRESHGMWDEIQCNHCGGHLGHVFTGERFTNKNTRHCVNSLSIRFIPSGSHSPEVTDK